MGSFTRFREENVRLICALSEINMFIGFFRSIAGRSALPCFFLAADLSGAVRSVTSIAVENECVTVFEGVSTSLPDSGRLSNSRSSAPYRRPESIRGWPATAVRWESGSCEKDKIEAWKARWRQIDRHTGENEDGEYAES